MYYLPLMLSLLKIKAINECKTAKHYLNIPVVRGYMHSHSTKHQCILETPKMCLLRLETSSHGKKTLKAEFTGGEPLASSAD